MGTIFIFNNKYYQTTNLDKKLKRLKINKDDIKIIYQDDITPSELEKKFLEISKKIDDSIDESWHNPKLYYYHNIKTNETIISVYDNLNNIPNINQNDWIRTL